MKKLLATFLALLMIFSAIPTFAADGAVDIYVSAAGSDSAVGSIDAPLKTIDAALAMAKNELELGKAVNIIIRGGTYRISNVTTLTGAYSGPSAEKPLTIKGYEGEDVVFKASRVIDVSNAQPVTDAKVRERLYESVRDKLIVVDLGAQGIDAGQIFSSNNVNNNYQLNQNTNGNFLQASEYNCVYVGLTTVTTQDGPRHSTTTPSTTKMQSPPDGQRQRITGLRDSPHMTTRSPE